MLIENLVANWLAMFMYEFQRDTQCSTHLYRLVRALGHYLDMAPCDAVAGRALHSLSEERLLVDSELAGAGYQVVYVNVMLGGGVVCPSGQQRVFVVPLVDLDTVEQAKEKCVDVMVRHGGFAGLKPSARDVELELCLIIIPNDQAGAAVATSTTTLIALKDTEEELLLHQNGYELFFMLES